MDACPRAGQAHLSAGWQATIGESLRTLATHSRRPFAAARPPRAQAPASAAAPPISAQRVAPAQAAQPAAGQAPAAAAPAAAARPQPEPKELPLYRSPPGPIAKFGFSTRFRERYELGEKIGRGASCTVHAATDLRTGERVAVKVMPKLHGPDGFLDAHFAARVRNEVDISSHLKASINVCYFHGAYETDSAVKLVLEECSGGQLWDRVLSGKYTERQAARLVLEILRTVAQCHSRNVMIRDIKPQNFLFATPDEASPIKAVDFGVAVFCKPGQYITTRAGTRTVWAPEVVHKRYSLPADIWAVGITAYLLLTGRLPFPFWDKLQNRQKCTADDMHNDILHAELDFEAPPLDTVTPEAREFVSLLLQRDELRRPTAEEALQHSWLQQDQPHGKEVPLSKSIVQRLQRFGTYGHLKQVALRAVATCIPSDSVLVEDMRGLFTELDPLDRGCVPFTQLQEALEEGSYMLSPAETQQLLAQLDMDSEGNITLAEFLAQLVDWHKLRYASEWDALVERAFQALDRDSSGRIGPRDLMLALFGEEGCQVPDQLESALREAKIEMGGGLNLQEFHELLDATDQLHLFEPRIREPPEL